MNIIKLLFLMFLLQAAPIIAIAQPVIWNVESIKKAKREMSSEPVVFLLRDADKALKAKITTVVDKEMMPPSGTKHDYMSMGRYWWPNPDTADGLPYVRRDGVSNPEIYKLDRYPLGRLASAVSNLALAYHLTNDEKYAIRAVDNLRKWFLNVDTRMNPHLNYGQTVPGHNNGLGRGFGIIDTYSFVQMLDGVELLKASKNFSENDREELQKWFAAYLEWMINSPLGVDEYASKNNHGTAFDAQLVRYALFVGNNDIAKKYIDDFANRRIFTQIEPDGSQPLELVRTTSLGYTVFNLHHFIDMCYMAKVLGVDLLNATSADGRSIFKAIEFAKSFLGTKVEDFPYQQISEWDKVQQRLALLLYRVDNLIGESMFKEHYELKLSNDIKSVDLIVN